MEQRTTRIPLKGASSWATTQGTRRPTSISTNCPHCRLPAVFSLSSLVPSPLNNVWPTQSKCPGCLKPVTVSFYYGEKGDGDRNPIDCVLYPAPSHPELPPSIASALPEGIYRALKDAEDTFIAGMYSPSVTSGRRAMEGIFKHLAPEEERGKRLYDLIEHVCKSTDATEPLHSLSHAIREGGNLGAHFDLEKEADEETARAVLELLSHLASYFFLLPERIAELENKLGAT